MRRAIEIDRALMLEVFNYDPVTGRLTWRAREGMPRRNGRYAGKEAGCVRTNEDGKSYRKISVDGLQMLAHRAIWTMVEGPIPDDMMVDHEDGNGLWNAWENLRLVDDFGNRKNVRKSSLNTTGYVGVRRADTLKESYQAFVNHRGVFTHLGVRPTAQEAYELRLDYERRNGFHPNNGQERPL